MWEIIGEISNNPIVQLFIAVFSGTLSYDALRKFYYRPILKIEIWDKKSNNYSYIKRKIKFKRKPPFIYFYRSATITLTGNEMILTIENAGRSAAKDFSFYGRIPESWEAFIAKSSVLPGGLREIEEWEREWVDKEEEKLTTFRISGRLPAFYLENIMFKVTPPPIELVMDCVAENVGHFESHIFVDFDI